MTVKLQQQLKLPGKQQIDKFGNWVFVLPENIGSLSIKKLPYGEVLENRKKRLGKKSTEAAPLVLDLPNRPGSHLSLGLVKPDICSFDMLTLARKLIAAHNAYNPATLGVLVTGFDTKITEKITDCVLAAALAASATMPKFKAKNRSRNRLQKIHIYGINAAHGFNRTVAEAEGNALARNLSVLPSNMLTPAEYLQKVKQLARENKWQLGFYDIRTLKRKKAGAFLAVAQGSPTNDAGIVRLAYKPPGKPARKEKLTLVGKGICYDTGGTNLKPASYMYGMHEDMQGSAVALGTLLALTRLRVNFPVECWMALAMNHIGPKAYKPNDVVTASDGTTIEVVNTDAEGRMVLADTLALASKENPELIIDYATLTGACIYSLGTAYSGVFTNHEQYIQTLIDTGRDSGERVWPFPLDDDYDKLLESDIADIKQCAREGGADHILAARFLKRFIKNRVKWIHIDLASSTRKGGLAHIPTDTTGFGIRFTLNLLLDKKII